MVIETASASQVVALTDEEIVERVLAGETSLFDVDEIGPGRNVGQFAGRAKFSTWLTRIAVHEASARLRRRGRQVDIEESMPMLVSAAAGPEQRASDHELAQTIEAAVNALPEVYRSVFMLREVEGLTTAETAACLEINEETAKTRLHRARALLRNHINARVGAAVRETFEFAGARCDRMVAAVMARISDRRERHE